MTDSKYIKIGFRHFVPLEHIVRCEIDTDLGVKVYLNEKIGPFQKYIKTPTFASFSEAESWINQNIYV